ncbi:MAG: hypothetical protein ACHQD6_00840 [Steroidobacterales bacterium]|jgi:hypothetical protein
MNTVNALYRDLTCATGAFVITLVMGLSFVQSTSVPPGLRASMSPIVAAQLEPGWFGQPQPAVLVD